MHFLTLVTVNIPPQEPDPEMDQEIAEQAALLLKEKESAQHPYLLDIAIERCNSRRNSFSRAVDSAVESVMDRYFVATENPNYLEFCDFTEELKKEYTTAKVDCFQLAEGRIVPYYDFPVCGEFTIHDGKVYKKHCGPLRHEKRNKQAKRMKALPGYPFSRIYPSYEDFAENYYGYAYYEEQGGYGYYHNPNGFWDWYSIGGRWPDLFLVKEDCQEYSTGERSWTCTDNLLKAPEGYKWVCAARKKDIAWQAIRDWNLQKAKEHFKSLKKLFLTGERDKGIHGTVTADGIAYLSQLIYHKGEHESDYLARCGFSKDPLYPVYPYDYLDVSEYRSQNDITTAEGKITDSCTDIWEKTVEDYIDSLDDDTVLVGVDHHE